MSEHEDDCIQNKSHFEHLDEVKGLLENLLQDQDTASPSLKRLNDIFDLYQQQSQLLDPYLELMVQPAIAALRQDVESRGNVPTRTLLLFRYLYLLTKTRGYKTIVKFMSHEVTDLEPILDFLCSLDAKDSVIWEARYICFLWLSLICMIPFDLKRVDSAEHAQDSLISRMLGLCKQYLKSTGKEREAAGLLVARLLSRRDLCGEYMLPYFEWCKERLGDNADVFETTGILLSLCTIHRYAPRESLLHTLDDTIVPLLTMDFFKHYANNSLVQKLRTKLTQRVGLSYLKPKIASWRYQRGSRSLRQNLGSGNPSKMEASYTEEEEGEDWDEDIPENLEVIIDILLSSLRDKDTIVRWSAAKGLGRITQRLPRELAEDVIGSILELFEENILVNNGKRDFTAVSDHTWHGASLAVAELARRGLLLPERLEETIPSIVHALRFDLKRGSHSIGAHVRDAACYVCWSFARAYAPNILEPFVVNIAQNLVVVSVFDREINVRRASSAAFQENVGRQGIFPCGIDIIQTADYFSVGNRNNAFLHVAVEIAKFEDYRYHLIQHLVTVTSKHWDKAMRVLASKALYRLVALDPKYFIDNALPDLIPSTTSTDLLISHGAMLAVGEICLGLWECRKDDQVLETYWQSKQDLVDSIRCIVAQLPPRSLSTFGSEHIREAACHMIECFAHVRLPAKEALVSWKLVISSSLERKEENVQEFAVAAFGAVAETYGITKDEVYVSIDKISSARMVYGRRGHALALGTLTYSENDWLHDTLHALCSATQIQKDQQANDAEAKRNAVIGLTNMVRRIGDRIKSGEFRVVSVDDFRLVFETLQQCLTDYSTDQRGDVGSWVRCASMDCLHYLIPCVAVLDAVSTPKYLTADDMTCVLASLLKQGVERIDKVRARAGAIVSDFIYESEAVEIPNRDVLKMHISRTLLWESPAVLYPTIVHVLVIPAYRLELLTGLITSAGGLTESLVRHSSACLIEYLRNLEVTQLQEICQTLLEMFVKYEKQDRVTMPLLDVVGLLYDSDILSALPNDSVHSRVFTYTRKETFKCKNVKKLLSGIKVYIGLMSLSQSQVKTKAFQQMLSYLVHAYPRVRTEVADQLYTYISLLDEEDATEDTMEAEEILTGTDWTGPVDEIKVAREKLYALLNVPKPVLRVTNR
ncbi:hypothetical protein DFQ28_006283 [Apophysomyces sp. BC1034]|nr:hypothetical protein DFQ30_006848 [Apophysomyces sp. BC1015]KAG0178140.1 hypothetical protein DFQ29_003868 [Apophysomyces sp. BC1021]KAG0187485.1 hypothetical protein DFQ28_006283 [Apophysomyces sp. BC1034]